MPDSFIAFFSTSLFAIAESIFVTWLVLKIICYSNNDSFNFFYIVSGKSTTNARLLGGVAVSLSMICALISVINFYDNSLNILEVRAFYSTLISMIFLTFYGYVDDKYEVRVRFKLIFQFGSIFTFAYFNIQNVFPEYPIITFIFSSVLGLALVNGTNLLDGLDTLSIKLGVTSSFAFLVLGIVANSNAVIYLSIILISSLAVFYFFNREPARVYMGEIGGSLIGLTYFIQFSICLMKFKNQMSIGHALALALIPVYLPICELGISFTRRVVYRKSPFRGDKLHLHYVLKNRYNLSASSTSNLMGISNFLLLGFGFLLVKLFNPVLAICVVFVGAISSYLWICRSEWKANLSNEAIENLSKIFQGKSIHVIDSSQFGTLDISVTDEKDKKEDKKKSA